MYAEMRLTNLFTTLLRCFQRMNWESMEQRCKSSAINFSGVFIPARLKILYIHFSTGTESTCTFLPSMRKVLWSHDDPLLVQRINAFL